MRNRPSREFGATSLSVKPYSLFCEILLSPTSKDASPLQVNTFLPLLAKGDFLFTTYHIKLCKGQQKNVLFIFISPQPQAECSVIL